MLEMTGVIESAEAKMDKVYDAIVSLQSDINSIKTQLASIEKRLIELQDTTDKIKYDTSAAAWNSFYYGNDYKQLRNKISDYNAYIESNIVSFLNGNKKITIYYDTDGEITVPMSGDTSKSYRNIDIDTSKTQEYTFTAEQLKSVISKSSIARKAYDGILSDLGDAFKNAYPDDNLGEKIFKCYQMQLNYAAVKHGKISGIADNFKNTCEYLLGGSRSKAPLEYFYEMMSYVYNFDSQTTTIKQSAISALSSAIIGGHALASLEISFETPYAGYDTINELYSQCSTYLQSGSLDITLTSGGQWSFIAGRELRLGYLHIQSTGTSGYRVEGSQGVAQVGNSKGVINGSDVSTTMLAYGSVVDKETIRRMVLRAKANDSTLENDMLTAGYDRDMVLNKSDYMITSSVWGKHREDVKGESLQCVEIIHDSDNYYELYKWYNINNGIDDRWAICADIADIYTGEQWNEAEIIVTGYEWHFNFFERNDEIYFAKHFSSNQQYIKFF